MKASEPKNETSVAGLAALSLSCKEAVRLQSEGLDRKLPFPQRMGLRLHILFCKWCRRYGRQLEFLRAAAKQQAEMDGDTATRMLSAEARQRMNRAIQANRDQS